MDFREGDSVLNRGMKLAARHIAMLSAMDISAVPVVRRPRIAVLATGDELVRPGEVRGPAQIVAASLDGLLAQLALWGAEPIDLGIARDDAQAIAAAAGRAGDADMLITLGGASVGDHDLVRAALAPGGLSLEFWKIAMRPGKPLMFGTYRGKPFLGLPGNPVSTLVCSILFVQSAIAKMSGDVSSPIETWPEAALNTPLPANDQRMDFLRAQMVEAGRVRPFARQDSSELSALSSADVLICRPPFDPAKAEGDMVNVMYLGQR
jgi:molybdopterin molybdotransferase